MWGGSVVAEVLLPTLLMVRYAFLCLLLLSQSLKIALDVRRLSRKIAPPSWVRSIRFSVDYTDVHVILPR